MAKDTPSAEEVHQQQVKSGQQGTNEPWKRPGQASQNPDQPEPRRREGDYEENKTS